MHREVWKPFRDRKGKAFFFISLILESYPKQNMIHARFHDPPAMMCWCRGRDKKPLGNCKSLWAEEASLEKESCPMRVGLALGSAAEGRGVTCSIQLGSMGSPSPRGFAQQPSLLSSYRLQSQSGQILLYFGRMNSTAASICPKFTLPHYQDDQFINGEPPQRRHLGRRLVRAAERRIPRRVSGEMCSGAAQPGDVSHRDFRGLIASWEALITSQEQACTLCAEHPTKPHTPGCWDTTSVLKMLWPREAADLEREPQPPCRIANTPILFSKYSYFSYFLKYSYFSLLIKGVVGNTEVDKQITSVAIDKYCMFRVTIDNML